VNLIKKVLHFKALMIDCILHGRKRPAMIYGAQWVDSRAGFGHQARVVTYHGGIQEALEEFLGHRRHIAGDDQVPVLRSGTEGGEDSAKGPRVFHQIGQGGEPERGVFFRSANQRHVSSGAADAGGDSRGQGGPVDFKQRLIAAHPGASAAGEHESCTRMRARAFHEKMVASIGGYDGYSLVSGNKTVYICSLALLAMLAASPMRAADRPDTSPLLASPASEGKVSVVRVDRRSGKLVRAVTDRGANPSPLTAAAQLPAQHSARINELVESSSRANGIDPLLVHSVIQVESGYNRYAMSPKGAEGLMQLMPSTARMLGVGNSFDEAQNIEAGVKYLKYLQGLYKDDRLALAAYNAGPASVDRFKQVPPYPETQAYVERVAERYRAAHQVAEAKQAAAQAGKAPADPGVAQAVATLPLEKHPKLEQFFDDSGRLSLRTKIE
jgi:soluble lytic murein transglycosylase-like protein